VVVKIVSYAMAIEPDAGLLHGVAVLDAIDGDGFCHRAPVELIWPSVFVYAAPGSSASPSSIGCAIASCSLSLSSSPSERLMTMHATPLPIKLVNARHSLMNLSMPTR